MQKKKDYKVLVIIGNGFDIAHNLPTKYSNFMEQLTEEHSTFYETICRYIPEDSLWASFEEALADLDDEQLQDDNSCYLLGYGDENWKDSAHHDFQYMIGEALIFAKDIPQYFSNWILSINTCASPIMPTHLVDRRNIFLSFNYTDTLETVYGIPENHICYIHGKAKRGDNLVVGHHSENLIQDDPEPQFTTEEERQMYYENYDEDVRVTEAKGIIKDYFKNTYKDTATIIAKNKSFFDLLSQVNKVYIYGHSLSDIDFDYFSEVCKCVAPYCEWHIFYRTKGDYQKAIALITSLNIVEYKLIAI